jgi:hypothetical protein
MLMEIPYLGFLFRCYSGPLSDRIDDELMLLHDFVWGRPQFEGEHPGTMRVIHKWFRQSVRCDHFRSWLPAVDETHHLPRPRQLALEIGGKLLGFGPASDSASDQENRFDYSAERALIRREYSEVVSSKIGRNLSLYIRERNYQVGLDRKQIFHLER